MFATLQAHMQSPSRSLHSDVISYLLLEDRRVSPAVTVRVTEGLQLCERQRQRSVHRRCPASHTSISVRRGFRKVQERFRGCVLRRVTAVVRPGPPVSATMISLAMAPCGLLARARGYFRAGTVPVQCRHRLGQLVILLRTGSGRRAFRALCTFPLDKDDIVNPNLICCPLLSACRRMCGSASCASWRTRRLGGRWASRKRLCSGQRRQRSRHGRPPPPPSKPAAGTCSWSSATPASEWRRCSRMFWRSRPWRCQCNAQAMRYRNMRRHHAQRA